METEIDVKQVEVEQAIIERGVPAPVSEPTSQPNDNTPNLAPASSPGKDRKDILETGAQKLESNEERPNQSPDAPQDHPLLLKPKRTQLTVFEGPPDSRLTKEMSLDNENTVVTTSAPLFFEGIARTESIIRLTDLEQLFSGLETNQCIATGVFDRYECSIVSKSNLTEERLAAGVRARSLELMTQPSPGLMLFDYDPSPHMPENMRCDSPAELMEKLSSLSPLLEGIGFSGAGSASNGIINLKTGEPHTKNGFHCYIQTEETDLRALRDWLRAKCWIGGFGYIDFGRNGVMLERCLVDISVISPERLIYEADPVLAEGLERKARQWTHQAGTLLAGEFTLTKREVIAYKQAVLAAKADSAVIDESNRLYREYYDLKSTELAQTKSITTEEAKRRCPPKGPPKDLTGDAILYQDDTVYINGRVISVEDLITQGKTYDSSSMPDPIEGPVYGASTAMFFYNEGRNPVIHSFAHGQNICYSIKSHGKLIGIEASTRLDPEGFPHTVEVKGKTVPAPTIPSLRHMLDGYDIRVYYNVIGKKLDLRIPELQGSPDNIDNSALTQIMSLCALNGMKTGQVSNYIAAIGDQAQYNPVTEWICSKPWDGVDRLEEFYATLTTDSSFPEKMKKILMFRWLVSAVAAAFMPSGFHARGVLVLQGPQSMGKTSWVKNLISYPMLRETVIKVDHHLDASNKDSIVLAISHWIVELGELESTMKRNVPRLKGFITSDSDKVRLPYAPRESTYQRRTVFCATVNREDFLVDDTGNTRWWTLPVVAINYEHGIDMQQLWAQMYHIYETEKPNWWLSPAEEQQLEQLNQAHRATSTIRQILEASIDFGNSNQGRSDLPVMNATSILKVCGKQNPSNTEAKECASVMRELMGESSKSGNVRGWRVYWPDVTEVKRGW
jgi:hypothetical protein